MIYVRADDQENPHSDIQVEVKGDDMKDHGYDKIAMSLMFDRIHELLPIEGI